MNLVFDFGMVLMDWNPHHLYDSYFGSAEKADYFIKNICNMEWNLQMDAGRPFAETVPERIAQFPEWEEAIRVYQTRWQEMIGGEIPGMNDLLARLEAQGVPLYGITNWSAETLPPVIARYNRIFSHLRGYVVSGEEHVTKPNPRIYQILMERYHLLPQESIFIDDSRPNIDGALNIGMQGILFQSASQLEEELRSRGILH